MNRRRFLTLSAAFACAPHLVHAATWRGRALGAEVSVTLHGPRPETARALTAIPTLLTDIAAEFSLYDPTSSLSRLNLQGKLDDPSPSFAQLLTECDRAHALTDGLFDPTVQPLWHALAQGHDPAPARKLIGWSRVAIDAQGVRLQPGQKLTFNGIAQGYATDLVTHFLRLQGFDQALVNMGEHRALGGPFRLSLEDPDHGPLGQRTLTNRAIATSSPTALHLGQQTHIQSPDGRAPLWSTVSIEALTSTLADALSTAAVFLDRAALVRLRTTAHLHRITLVDTQGNVTTL